MKRSATIALTGGIACGKSEVAGILAANGVPVVDTDVLAHELLSPGHVVYEKVIAEFGRAYLTGEGAIDRRKLGALVFSQPAARDRLNAIMHPAIYQAVFAWVEALPAQAKHAVAVVPLLFETGMEKEFGPVVVVAADDAIALRRMAARGWTEQEARLRMRAQWPLAEKIRRADAVIWNNLDLPALKQETELAWKKLTLGKEQGT